MCAQATALVTGASGFCARHLVAHLFQEGYQVAGLDRDRLSPAGIVFFQADISDAAAVRAVLEAARPDIVFHLAALLNPRLPFDALHRVNAEGTLNLLDAALTTCPETTIFVTSTSAVYGQARSQDLPITENEALRPANLYAVTKITQEMLGQQHYVAFGLRVIRTRTFNMVGPGESPAFVTSGFARQVAEIELGRREPVIRVGNLESVRDFTDVRDAVRAYRLLGELGEPGGVYNVCSGRGTQIRHILEILLGLSTVRDIAVEVDAGRFQPADVPIQVGDPARLKATTGWSPSIALEQSLADVLNDWRTRVRAERS